MRRGGASHRTVELRVNSLPDAIDHHRDNESRNDHRIEPGSPAQGVIRETALPSLGDPGDNKAREYEKDQDGSMAVSEGWQKNTPADALNGIMPQEHRKRGAKP